VSAPRRPKDAIVIGDGVIGLTCAIALQRGGIQTMIVAPDAPWRGASWGNAGHIAIEQVEPLAAPATLLSFPRRLFVLGGPLALPPHAIATWLPFALKLARFSTPARFRHGKAALGALLREALPAWRRLLADADAAQLLREEGHFVVWETDRTANTGLARWRSADIGEASFRPASPEELAELRTLFEVPIAGAIRFRGSAQIADNSRLGEALHVRFRSLGGQVKRARALHVTDDSGAKVTLDDGAILAADLALVAAGAASGALLHKLGENVPLIAERGYHIEGVACDWPSGIPPIVFEDRSLIVTRFDNAVRAASFTEFASAASPPDPRKWARLRAHVRALGYPVMEPTEEWVGARPTLPDYLPAIGRLASRPSIAYAFGHQHLGLTLAAVTGEVVAAMLRGGTPKVDLSPFDLARFA
jgi:D-amino-acid dehydrogenase